MEEEAYEYVVYEDEEIVDNQDNLVNQIKTLGATKKSYECYICQKILGHRSSLYKHLKFLHKVEPASRLPISCREPGCNQSFTFIDPFRRHLQDIHDFEIVVVKYLFNSMNEFYSWKNETEQEDNVKFIVSTGPRSSKGGKTHYFRCHRNGIYKPERRKRAEMNGNKPYETTHCISSMFVFEEVDLVTVEYCQTHYGHDLESEPFSFFKRSRRHSESYQLPVEQVEDDPVVEIDITNVNDLKEYLSDFDKLTLRNVIAENDNIFDDSKEIYYENENRIMMKIPAEFLKQLYDEDECDESVNEEPNNFIKVEPTSESEHEEQETELDVDTKIYQSLGNGVFQETNSLKTIKIGDGGELLTEEDNDKASETDAAVEILSEDEGLDSELEGLDDLQKRIIVRRKRLLSQLQNILLLVNEEEDEDKLIKIEDHLKLIASAE